MDARRKIQLPREQLLRLYGPSAADGRQPVAALADAAAAAALVVADAAAALVVADAAAALVVADAAAAAACVAAVPDPEGVRGRMPKVPQTVQEGVHE